MEKKYFLLKNLKYDWWEMTRRGKLLDAETAAKYHEGEKFYTLEQKEAGTFLREGFPAEDPNNKTLDFKVLQKIPQVILEGARAILGRIYKELGTEAVVFILWDRVNKGFFLDIPTCQDISVGSYSIEQDWLVDNYLNRKDILVAGEFHSHPNFGSYFSAMDQYSVDSMVNRIYGNIAFRGDSDAFGKLKVKVPGMQGSSASDNFLDPKEFFLSIPEEDEEIRSEDFLAMPKSKYLVDQIEEVINFNMDEDDSIYSNFCHDL